MDVGFIGLGQMGAGMASNLLRGGHRTVVFNRTAEKALPLVAVGAQQAQALAEACRGRAVFTMLADDEAVEAATLEPGGVLELLAPGALHVSSSTISVALARRLADAHARAGQLFVSAPVLGRPDVALAGKLFVLAAGEPEARKAAEPLLGCVGQKTFVIEGPAEAANLVKLACNFMIAATIESLGEAFAFVNKGGVEQKTLLDILTSTMFSSPIHKTYGSAIVERAFEPPGFAAALGAKDIRLFLSAAEELRAPLPLASLLRDRFLALLADGGDRLDWSAIGALAAKDAGLTD